MSSHGQNLRTPRSSIRAAAGGIKAARTPQQIAASAAKAAATRAARTPAQKAASAAKAAATRAANKAAKAAAVAAVPTTAPSHGSSVAWARSQASRLNLPNATNARQVIGQIDQGLVKIAEEQGFTGAAKTMTKAQIDQLVRQGATEWYRGVTTTKAGLSQAQAKTIVKDYAQSVTTGPYVPRSGWWGSGLYVATGRTAQATAAHYATKGPVGVAMRGVFLPGSRIGNSYQLDQQRHVDGTAFMRNLGVSRPGKLSTADYNQFVLQFGDLGRYAANKGYDAIYVTHNTKYVGEMYILNRSAIAVQRYVIK